MERSTRQRTAIRQVIIAAARPLTPHEILEGVRETVSAAGIATIYRNIKLLLDEGDIRAVMLPGESPRYESVHEEAGHDHHHHFHCLPCDRVFDVPGCPGPMAQLAPAGFTVERHELTLYGVCAECSAASALTKKKPSKTPKA